MHHVDEAARSAELAVSFLSPAMLSRLGRVTCARRRALCAQYNAGMKTVGLVVLGACTSAEPQHVVDSSGAPFVLQPDGTIDIVDETPAYAPCPDDTRPIYAWALGRFITIASACVHDGGAWSSSSNSERPLACAHTDECPQWKSWSFECRSGLCQNADTSRYAPLFVNWGMATELCNAPFPRSETVDPVGPVALQVYQATTSVCPSTASSQACTLPLPSICWQP